MRERATAQIETQKDRALDGLGSVAQAVRGSTQRLRDEQHDSVARYVEQAADQLERIAQRLREKDVSEFVDDVQRFARRQPAVFIGSAFALGLIGARFLKSSSDSQREWDEGRNRYSASTVGYPSRTSGYPSVPQSGRTTSPGAAGPGSLSSASTTVAQRTSADVNPRGTASDQTGRPSTSNRSRSRRGGSATEESNE
jgi:hypothetical protein